jgi:hypothetical protein
MKTCLQLSYGVERHCKGGRPLSHLSLLQSSGVSRLRPATQAREVASRAAFREPQKTSVDAAAKEEEDTIHFGGALATILMGAVLLSERLNGKGIIANLEIQHHEMHPILVGSVIALTATGFWPNKHKISGGVTSFVRALAARAACLGLAASIAAEMVTGRGLLALLDIETGVEALSEVEAGLAFLSMILLVSPNSRVAK